MAHDRQHTGGRETGEHKTGRQHTGGQHADERRRRLDDPQARAAADPGRMGHRIYGLPEQCEEGYRLGLELDLTGNPIPAGEVRHLVLAGLGGSAIGGDLLKAFLADRLAASMEVVRDYRLPAYAAGPDALVLASSYSGNTEETLSAYTQAQQVRSRIVALTTGGTLLSWARRDGHPAVQLPSGLPPRAALGYSLFSALGALERLGLIGDSVGAAVSETAERLRQMRRELGPEVPLEANPAKQEALALVDRLPIVFGGQGLSGVAAYRWKCQFNENSKHLSWWHQLPELNHNEIVGWEAPSPEVARLCRVYLLRSEQDLDRVALRFEVTQEILNGTPGGGILEVWSRGRSALARGLSLVYFGDWVSYYLALAKGVDPTPVRTIDRLKGALANAGTSSGGTGRASRPDNESERG